MKIRLSGVAIASLLYMHAGPSLAAFATWTFSGTIADIVDSTFEATPNPYTGFFSIGDAWTASLTVDLDSPMTPSSGLGNYDGAITAGSLTVLSNNFTFDLWAQEFVHIDNDPPIEGVTMQYSSLADVNGETYHLVGFDFFDWTIAAPTSLAELATNFDLAVINDQRVSVYAGSGPTHHVDFALDSASVTVSAVPVPAALWLFGPGLLGILGLARQGRAA